LKSYVFISVDSPFLCRLPLKMYILTLSLSLMKS